MEEQLGVMESKDAEYWKEIAIKLHDENLKLKSQLGKRWKEDKLKSNEGTISKKKVQTPLF